MSISPAAIHSIDSREDFLRFLSADLMWPIPDDLTFEDLTFDAYPEELGIRKEELRGSQIVQLRQFVEGQPWGIFIVQLAQPRLYTTELRKLLRGLEPRKRTEKAYKTWHPKHILFICTHDWKSFTFAHFDGDLAQNAKITTFGWDHGSDFVRTLCQYNLPSLVYPTGTDMFGLDPAVWVKQWASAFDVKKVTDTFYHEYDGIFKNIKRQLAKQFSVPAKLYEKPFDEWTEKESAADERLHLFVQNLVNRLMFLKFLEKRRWLDFNPNYLADLYKRALAEKKNFYEQYLFYVFFAGLNRQVEFIFMGEGKTKATAQFFQERIGVLPFLNGGLFEKDIVDEQIEIPNEAFRELFDLFSRYNFTVNEDTPLDIEVAVNPEMLGKVFEESVISRKEKGAYYTPRNIVSFMCREALKNHLETQCKIENGKLKINSLVDGHNAKQLNASEALELYKALYSIKVLDPAVGSGAFPVGMMFEILECYKTIGAKLERDHPYLVQNKLANPKDVYKLKKQIIQNNLYGVDLEDFAVNIARLRFWLSLAVDFPIQMETREEFIAKVNEIEPLPNLMYKIRQGDSLLAKYHGVSLELNERMKSGEFNANRKKRITDSVSTVTELKRTFFEESDSSKKKGKQMKIDGILKDLVAGEIDAEIELLKESSSQQGLFGLTKKEKQEQEKQKEEIERLQGVKKELLAADTLPPHFPVIWDVDFGEVLSEGGFDVVIANPPYVRQEEFKEIKDDLALHYDCYTGTADLFTYFYERGVKLLKPGGTISYISSNKYFRAGYGKKLREYLTTNTTINVLIDFGDLPVFEATAYPSVLVATKKDGHPERRENPTSRIRTKSKDPVAKQEDSTFSARTFTSHDEFDAFEMTFRSDAIQMKQIDLDSDGWRIENSRVVGILTKIKNVGISLEENAKGKIYYGIKTGFNEAFVISSEIRDLLINENKESQKFIKPFLRGRDIKRYSIDNPNLWLIYIPNNWTNVNRKKMDAEIYLKKTIPAISKYLNQFEKQLKARDDQGDYWWEMRPCKYLEEFEKPKIVWGNLGNIAGFTIDNNSYYTSAPSCLISSHDVVLLGILNSSLSDYMFHQIAAIRRGGYLEYKPMYVSQLPIAKGTEKQRRAIDERVEKILKLKKAGQSTRSLEKEIDEIVYEMYGLTEEERGVVEGNGK